MKLVIFVKMGDHFKVVFIKELNEVEPIPHKWEKNTVLYWPPTSSEVRKNQSNPESSPNLGSWKKYSCVVKAQGISLFVHASATADQICQDGSSGSASSNDDEPNKKKKRLVRPPNKPYDQYISTKENYESLFPKHDGTSTNNESVTNKDFIGSSSQAVYLNTEQDDNSDQTSDQTITNTASDPLSFVSNSEILGLTEAVNGLKENIAKYDKRLISIENIMAESSVKLDKLHQLICTARIKEPDEEHDDSAEELMLPLENLENLQCFEAKLNEAQYRTKVILHLRKITGCDLAWKTASYKLSDVLFTKKLLTQFSWTGVSRISEQKKAFNKLINILDVFYQAVKYADKSFSCALRDQFFRDGILKHSHSRYKPKKRKSTGSTNEGHNVQSEAELPTEMPEEMPEHDISWQDVNVNIIEVNEDGNIIEEYT